MKFHTKKCGKLPDPCYAYGKPDGVAISQKGLSGLQTEEMRTKVTGIAALDGQEGCREII